MKNNNLIRMMNNNQTLITNYLLGELLINYFSIYLKCRTKRSFSI